MVPPVECPAPSSARSRRTVSALAYALLLSACGGDGGTSVREIASVVVTPATVTLTSLGATTPLTAAARDAAGAAIAGPDVTFGWSSSASGVASVDASGTVTAVSNGSATVTATVTGGAAAGSAVVTVGQEAATLTVTLDADTVTTDGTVQATVAGVDAGGTPLASPSPVWSSSEPAVATVDGSGLVTPVADGETRIEATQNGVVADAELVVIRPDLTLEDGAVVGGEVVVRNFVIPAGATVALGSPLQVDADGAVRVEGTLVGDCLGLILGGSGAVTVSGTLDNSCVTQTMAGEGAPALTVDAPLGVDLTDAEVISSGPVTVRSEPAAGVSAVVEAHGSTSSPGGPQRAPAPGTISLEGATLRASPSEVPQPTDPGASRPDGADMEFRAAFDVILNGTTIRAQHGGAGVRRNETSADPLSVLGGNGGDGGDITISLPEGATIRFRTTRGAVDLIPGNGGPGGPATATTTRNAVLAVAPAATATGGVGGAGGDASLFGVATLQEGSALNLVRWQVGTGGRGGNATAVAADGVDAQADRDAQQGGRADASAGSGGDAGRTQGGFIGMPPPDGKEGGGGGIARATAGRGGNGIRLRPHGALGGLGAAFGGRGGDGTEAGGRAGGDAIADGGDGGDGADVCATVTPISLGGQISLLSDPASSDPFIFNAGSGRSLSLIFRILADLDGPGGDGGGGGLLAALGGRGGFGRAVQAASGGAALGSGGNGGDGGEGVPGGSGGAGGGPGTQSDPAAQTLNPAFQNGQAGPTCAALRESAMVTPGVDPAQVEGTAIEIDGAAPWVKVAGVLADDGTVTATGRGTVAGVPDILVEFAGTWDASTQTLDGTYTIDSEKVIAAGHPVVYQVGVTGG